MQDAREIGGGFNATSLWPRSLCTVRVSAKGGPLPDAGCIVRPPQGLSNGCAEWPNRPCESDLPRVRNPREVRSRAQGATDRHFSGGKGVAVYHGRAWLFLTHWLPEAYETALSRLQTAKCREAEVAVCGRMEGAQPAVRRAAEGSPARERGENGA